MPRPIATINPLAGDASFILRHGRRPTPTDDQTERIATHLAFAEQVLRAADVSHLSPARQSARAELLAVLEDYIASRRFPLPEAMHGRLPAFVDREGTRCAVAALVDHAAGRNATARIDARFHDAFIADIDDRALELLAAEAALSRAELALIQPTYHYLPPPPPIVWQADLTGEAAVASTPGDHPVRGLVGLDARWEGRRNEFIGDPIVAVDADVGVESGVRVPYAVSARIGTEMLWFAGSLVGACGPCSAHRTGILAGVRLDGDGARVPNAWTVPVDAYWYVPWPSDRIHLGAVGGVRVRFAGADRALGWTAGLDLAVPHVLGSVMHPGRWRGFHVGVGVEQVADLTFLGLTVGVASGGRYDRDGRDW